VGKYAWSIVAMLIWLIEMPLYAQGPEWVVFDTLNSMLPSNQVQAIAADTGSVWIGTADGLARYNGSTWQVYDTANTPLKSSFITALATDGKGGVWVGTGKGVGWYDGNLWLVFDSSNAPFSNNFVTAIARGPSGVIWIGTEDGLVQRNDSTWALFNDSTSGFIEHLVRSVSVGPDGTLWVGSFDTFNFVGRVWKYDGAQWTSTKLDLKGLPSSFPDALVAGTSTLRWLGTSGTTGGALVRIAGDQWTTFDRFNSGLPNSGISSIALEDTLVWIATGAGLVSFDGTLWTVLDTDNSELPGNGLLAVALDSRGNKWAGTLAEGVAVYRKGGVLTSTGGDAPGTPGEIKLLQNYPNPFNPGTTIAFSLGHQTFVSLGVFDALGRRVSTLVSEVLPAGKHARRWNAEALAAGVYICRLQTGAFSQSRKMLLIK
jgi:hypothetical protein